MAERRMFAKAIIGSARFLRMPAASRLLYYDLGMDADDDGVVEAYTVMRKTGASDNDLQVLVSKGFVRVLNEDLVSLILDWKTNNYIQKDRYHPSIYAKLIDNPPMDTDCIQAVSNMDTQYRLGESRLGKDSVVASPDKTNTGFAPPSLAEVKAYIADNGFCVSADDFFNYYTSNGWTIRGVKMSDWQAAVRSWNSRPGARKPQRRDDLDDIM